jgi:hypothetical protein
MIQFGTRIIISNSFKLHYLNGNKALRQELEDMANPNDGHANRVLVLDLPANLPKPPNMFQRFFAWLGIIKRPFIRGSVTLMDGWVLIKSETHDILWNPATTLLQRFESLKRQCKIFIDAAKFPKKPVNQ